MEEVNKWYENLTYDTAKNLLEEKMQNMSRSFIAAGYYMKYIRDHELYKEDGYESIWEFAEANYGIKRTTASRWMAMNDRFSKDGNTPILAEQYHNFGKSQLQEMLYLDDKQMEQVAPDMTVKEIREIRKPEMVLEKPTNEVREILNSFAKKIIRNKNQYFRMDYAARVLNVSIAEELLKDELGKNNRTWYFNHEEEVYHINLFEDYIQLFGKECVGNYEWFYLMAAIQSMWNVVALEDVKTKASIYKDGMQATGKCIHNPEMLCTLSETAKRIEGDGTECATKCCWNCSQRGSCNLECNASVQREKCATSHTEEQLPGQMNLVKNFPEYCPDSIESVEEDVVLEVDDADQNEETPEEIIAAEILSEEDVEDEDVSDEPVMTELQMAREELAKEQRNLELAQEAFADEPNSVHVLRHKIRVAALASLVFEFEEMELKEELKKEQPELQILKNNEQRKEWLRNYKDWGLWYEDKNIGCRYYKYDFENGARLIAEVYLSPREMYRYETEDTEHLYELSYLHLIGGPEPERGKYGITPWTRRSNYCRHPNSETELIEFLKYIQKGDK